MRSNDSRRIYRSHRTVKVIASICIGVAAAVLVLFIFLFFYFQRYIVPTENGIKLEVPWLEETAGETRN